MILVDKLLICVHSFFRLTTITSIILLFIPFPFFLLSSSAMCNECCNYSSYFFTIHTEYLIYLCPPTLIPRYPSRYYIMISLLMGKKGLFKAKHLCLTLLCFLIELISPSTPTSAVWPQLCSESIVYLFHLYLQSKLS